MSKDTSIGVRIPTELKEAVLAAIAAHPLRPTLSQVAVRGLELVLQEMQGKNQ